MDMMPSSARAKKSRLLRLAGPAACIALIWTGLWFWLAQQAGAMAARMVAAEALEGRVWTCPLSATRGFPFALEWSCETPELQIDAGARRFRMTSGAFRVRVSIFHPGSIEASLASPLDLAEEQGAPAFRLVWSRMEAQVRGSPWSFAKAGLTIDQPAASRADSSLGGAKAVELVVLPAAGRDAGEHSYDAGLRIDNATVPQLDALARTATPVDVTAQAVVTRAAAALDQDWTGWLEDWRVAGGTIELSALRIAKAPIDIRGKGILSLDALHRVQGNIETSAAGIEELAARFGVSPAALKIGGLLNGLTGGAAPPAGAEGIQMPFRFKDGRVLVGPLKTPLLLAPLY